MKKINPIQIWKNGQNKTASVLDARIINDNLSSSCTFYWQLKEEDSVIDTEDGESHIAGQVLAEGNCTLDGDAYLSWDGDNDYAYEFVANQINVIIVV